MMMAKALTKEVDSKEEMMKCFKVFDKDGSGEIAREDLHHIIATMAEKLTEDEIKVSGVPSTYDKQNHIINSSI